MGLPIDSMDGNGSSRLCSCELCVAPLARHSAGMPPSIAKGSREKTAKSSRALVIASAVMLLLVVMDARIGTAQSVLQSMQTETEVRMGLLFGRQYVRFSDPAGAVNLRLDPELFLLGGALEFAPTASLSARLSGAFSVFERGHGLSETPHSLGNGSSQAKALPLWDLKPSVKSREAAGAYRILNWGGCHWSIVGGYRQISTSCSGQPRPDSSLMPGASFQVDSSFGMPFIGVGTTVLAPSWKGRVQLTASPVVHAASKTAYTDPPSMPSRNYHGTLSGSSFALEIDGAIPVRPGLLVRVFGSYHRLDVEGEAHSFNRFDFRSTMEADIGLVGLNLTYAF